MARRIQSFKRWAGVGGLLLLGIAALSCGRGRPFEKPPIHLNPNMDSQPKYKAQSESFFFADARSMRTPPEHTVARGQLRADDHYFTGRDAAGDFVAASPVPPARQSVDRGRERFGIYCVPCHGVRGAGRGEILRFKYPIPPTSLHDNQVAGMADGQLFHTITNGVRNMPSYKAQIPVADRWRIVAYIRQLQQEGD